MSRFSLYVPPQFTRVDLTDDAEIEASLSALVRSAPLTQQPVIRALVDEQLRPTLADLAARGVTTAILPSPMSPPSPVRPVITVLPNPIREGISPVDALTALAATDGSAELVDVPGLLAVRTRASRDATETFLKTYADATRGLEHVEVPADALSDVSDEDSRLTSTRVTYFIGPEEHPDEWYLVNLGVENPGGLGGEALRDDVIAIFDAMMSTFRRVA
jgi:hypothetical protein